LAVGCGSDERLSQGVPVRFELPASGAPAFGDVPWPSDLYLGQTGGVGVVPGLERVAAHHDSIQEGLSALDGFGRSTGALFSVDASVDPESLPRTWDEASAADASARIVDVDPSSPLRGTRYPALAKPLDSLGLVAVIPVPGVVLPPGVRHAVLLTTHARTAGGAPLVAARALGAIAAGSRSDAAGALYGEAIDALVASGEIATRGQIAGLAVFRTSNRVRELPELRARLGARSEPELLLGASAAPYTSVVFGVGGPVGLGDWLGKPDKDEHGREWPGGDNPGGIAHDQIAVVAHGAFVAPSFLDPKTRRFEKDGSGVYVLAQPDATVPVTLVIPKAPAPASGYPVVINGHGLSNDRGSMLSVANELCRAGFAVIGIDDVLHGARGGVADEENNFPGTYLGPDGIPDEKPLPIKFFAGFSDFVAVRDNFRQTVLDQTSLVRLIQSAKLDLAGLAPAAGGATPKLDPKRVYWSGGSLGGMMGTMTVAVEPEIRAAALQVPGASFVQLITTSSAKVSPLVTTLAGGTFGIQGEEVMDEFHPVGTLLAMVTEAGDPIGYAPHVLGEPITARTPPDLLVTYAVGDEVMPNIATVALMRALGVELATPALDAVPGLVSRAGPVSGNVKGRTAVAVQYAPANHGLGYGRWDTREFVPGVPLDGDERFPALSASFRIEMPIREHVAELVTFLSTANAGKAVVEVTAPPRADFDGDGVLDADDADPMNPKQQ
jgi:dienelactone hydrolase